ncbi:MAG TPA: YdcH family protein [Stellaceae bacterium]|nr:YdcH family protein [Stellaceae bacterium]
MQALAENPARRYHRRPSVSTGGNCMSQQDRIEALKEKHASLERAIDEESRRPLPDQAAIYDLKRQKLRIKDEIFQLERQ